MTKRRRRKTGFFDPDYRKKGWNKSAFAPKNSRLSMTQLSLAITFLLYAALYYIPATRPMMLRYGLFPVGILAVVFWIALALLIRRLTLRQIRRQVESVKPQTLIVQEQAPLKQGLHQRQKQKDASLKAEPVEQTTPVDIIQQQLDARKERLRGLPEAATMTPRDFEHEVAWLINTLTDLKAIVTGGAGDGGVDVKVYDNGRLVGIMQCKRYHKSRPLAPGHVRELYAVKHQFAVNTAYLVTSTRFTPETRKEADRLGIKLMDGDELERMRKQARERLRQQDERRALKN